ncbi:right-handed parallel beta-helix repeat-containing protein [Paucibacter sp. B2R-40]|uniref:right-handed parallel beta-helix repeat-containing protein n=1 Tax=Paucibacter sp. B2R-40 TaxID=2893554 RepID=UPI0021E4AAD0|nr:right-handed parallel beta-helix repeat-containing protein [Paucibacter sp. B2R-40]MCV2355624.1 right-handed parallel beta-helix repeat-containing protein [Paucibacter sp. B2R-40]
MNTLRLKTIFTLLGATMGLTVTSQALAVDGVILIDQARAMAGGVTTDDAPGFPVTIGTSGSYRLASNLNLGIGGGNTTAIEIRSPAGSALNVTLDLNGFMISGHPYCDFNGQSDNTCFPSGTGVGIRVENGASVTISNGGIRGMGLHGIFCLGACKVDGMTIANNGGSGMAASGPGAASFTLTRSTVLLNRTGISGSRGLVQSNVLEFNLGNAIEANNSALLNNLISGNGGLGLAGTGNGYGANVFTFNNGGDGLPQVSAGNIQTATNVCGAGPC